VVIEVAVLVDQFVGLLKGLELLAVDVLCFENRAHLPSQDCSKSMRWLTAISSFIAMNESKPKNRSGTA